MYFEMMKDMVIFVRNKISISDVSHLTTFSSYPLIQKYCRATWICAPVSHVI